MPCENHSCFIYDRGGLVRHLSLNPLEKIEWGRIANDFSTCTVTVNGTDCESDLSLIEAGRHELVVFRGGKRVWEGPIVTPVAEGDTLTIEARDVLRYTEGTVMRQNYDNSGAVGTTIGPEKSIDRALKIIRTEMGRHWENILPPANVVPHLQPIYSDDDFVTTTKTTRLQRTVYDDLDELASRSGLMFTTVGRSIVLFDSEVGLSRTPTLTEGDIAGAPQLSQHGDQVLAWAAAVANTEGNSVTAGTANGPNGFPDPYYGAWEGLVESSADEDGGNTDATRTHLNNLAKKYLKGRIPTPIELTVPDGVTLVPTSALYDVDLLVPGVLVPVRANFLTGTVTRMQQLTQVTWSEDSNGETCAIKVVSTDAVLREET